MSLSSQVNVLWDHVKSQGKIAQHNKKLFDIFEGDLLSYALAELSKQINPQSFDLAEKRLPPINVLIRVVDKLSKIYQQEPSRDVSTGSTSDQQLLDLYENSMAFNSEMNNANEFYNLFKNSLIQPYIHNRQPKLRTVSSDMFTVYSDSKVDPRIPTHVITYHTGLDLKNNPTTLYYTYTDQEFMIFDDDKNVRLDLMAEFGPKMEDGINVAGTIPFVYTNKSKNLLIPKIDTDVLAMVLLLPVMLADLNFAVMMQAFSIIYGIDIDDEGIKLSPNAFWNFKSDESTDKTPQLGVLKPQVDIEPTLNLIQAEISMWLQTKGIKPGAVGKLTAENYATGISKIIDEMDTSEERQKQVTVYRDTEKEFWDKITNYLHPFWRSTDQIDTRLDFSSGVQVETNFAPQLPLVNRGQIVDDLKKEVDAGFTTRFRAIKKLNPRMSDEEVKQLMTEIDKERDATSG